MEVSSKKSKFFTLDSSIIQVDFKNDKEIQDMTLRDENYYMHFFNENGKYMRTEDIDDPVEFNREIATELFKSVVKKMIEMESNYPEEIRLKQDDLIILKGIRDKLFYT